MQRAITVQKALESHILALQVLPAPTRACLLKMQEALTLHQLMPWQIHVMPASIVNMVPSRLLQQQLKMVVKSVQQVIIAQLLAIQTT